MAFDEARRLLAEAVETRVSPAAVVEAGRSTGAIWEEAFGRHSYDGAAPRATLDTIFDLASLTKVIATTSVAIREIGAGRVRLQTPIAELMPGWDADERRTITIRHLLDHSSGLPGIAKLWQHMTGRDAFERALRELSLERPPGAASVYSDPGFMLLGFALENLRAQPLDAQFRAIEGEWGGDLGYLPPASIRDRVAPTEFDAARRCLHHGDVHDENAAALGGVAGHAGLFGTARSVGAFARLVMRTFVQRTALGSPDLMRTFAAETDVPGSSRALGWDTMRPTSSCGTLMSPTAIGHTGFTGTSLWIDWERDLYVVLLTNRVHPTRENDRHIALRPRVHDAIVREVS